ncbi:peptidoglycan editing factor PgeF [Candidatus Sodalis sp. SoCistrobi]|uniref:peptidoglycan editing factor PgeF n=1 Tax=Candidatus Sodalis sp. SoCistrobi TaxID=1922216 RepID=UPI00093A8514|nr:peptidoglycan editing factor PgeF [Candidatus Sodalis sp. SoCistrobi]
MTAYSSLLSPIPGVVHGFGDKASLMPEKLQFWQTTLPDKKQVHGTKIGWVRRPGEALGELDGVITDVPGILLTVLTADCLPVLFCRRDGRRIGAVHAGWRGLLAGILGQFAATLDAVGDKPSQWFAAIGPAAGPCCYEVSQALVDEFRQRLVLPPALIAPRPRHLDLAAIARQQLLALGFSAVDTLGHCTLCCPAAGPAEGLRYTSFRRNSQQRERDPTHPSISGRNQHSGLVILPDNAAA